MINHWINAWKSIEQIYNKGLICSERHLQAELFHLLNSDNLFTKKYRLHVEPSIYSGSIEIKELGLQGIIPDMLVTVENSIVAHVELKYVPHGYAPYEKDITNLSKFYSIRGSKYPINLLTDPINGNWNFTTEFFVDSNIKLIYAIISNKDSVAITDVDKLWNIGENWINETHDHLLMFGTTDGIGKPKFWTKGYE